MITPESTGLLRTIRLMILSVTLIGAPQSLKADLPISVDPRLIVQLVAKEPQIVTPTGITVDAAGRIWVIENNTHFQPRQYGGHRTDRILIFDDFADDGHARNVSVFADDLTDCMSLALGKPGEVYLVSRNEIVMLRDTNGDGKADQRQSLVRLQTDATYPHNGLNGITFAPDGSGMNFCLGLNVGYPYQLIGSDGSTVTGGGEGGSIYRCRIDGSKVERVATGFWNCHDLTYDARGRLFAVDNDPDDRPPCRLLDIIDGGDYGWQYRNGRKGIHPFTSWFGERRGTLPMVSSTGEAPSGIVAYESNGLPDEYRGRLLVTAWGDHVIQHFKLEPKGASFTSKPEILIQGGLDFRPVGIAIAPDGSLVVSDWVDKSYPVHGHGRIWRIRLKDPPKEKTPAQASERREPRTPASPPLYLLRQHILAGIDETNRALAHTVRESDEAGRDPFIVSAVITAKARSLAHEKSLPMAPIAAPSDKVSDDPVVMALALRRSGRSDAAQMIPGLARQPDADVRCIALQWIGEERLREFADQIPIALKAGPVDRHVLEFALAARQKLTTDPPPAGKPPAEFSGGQLAVDVVFDGAYSDEIRRLALQLADPRDKRLSADKLKSLTTTLGIEAVRALAWREDDPAQTALRDIAADEAKDVAWRREAAAGLALSAGNAKSDSRETLLDLLHDAPEALRLEALRSLRGTLDRTEAARLMADLRTAIEKKSLGSDDDRREWAEQMLLASKGTPDALTDRDRKELASITGNRPADERAWQQTVATGGDPDAGRRVFYAATGARCFSCHATNYRGGNVGPDLSHVGAAMSRQKLVESILDPSREIAPLYVSVVLELRDGTSITGVGLEEKGAGKLRIRDGQGKLVTIDADQIVSQRPEKISLMPANLPDAMTVREFRDLISYLEQSK